MTIYLSAHVRLGVVAVFGESVTRHVYVPGVDDGYGEALPSFEDEVWTGVAFAPGSSSEPLRGGSTRVVTSATLYDPLSRPVDPLDQFTVRGRRYMVDGDASGAWVNPFTGWTPGGTVSLKAVSGG